MLKNFAVIGASIILTLGLGFAYAWHQMTQLPDWYTEGSQSQAKPEILTQQDLKDPMALQTLQQNLNQKLLAANLPPLQLGESRQPSLPGTSPGQSLLPSSSPRSTPSSARESRDRGSSLRKGSDRLSNSAASGDKSISFNGAELNELLVLAAYQSDQSQPFIEGVQGIKTQVQDRKIKSELIVNLSKVDAKRLDPVQAQVVAQLTRQLPAIAQDNLVVSIVGQPQIHQGQLILDPDTQISIAGIPTTLTNLAKISGTSLEIQPIPLNLGEFSFTNLTYAEDRIILQGH